MLLLEDFYDMTVRNAVRQRILNLCDSRGITINKLGTICGVTQSTFNNIINTGSKNPTVSTIAKICDGLEITVREFFNDDLFENIEQEIV
jgi:transcriptional regulator with XRE-family HTH domain